MSKRFDVAARGGQAGNVEALLHRHRHAEQRRVAIASGIQSAGTVARTVEVAHHDGVDARIEAFNTRDVVVEQFAAGQFAGTQAGSEAGGRLERQVHVAHSHPGGGTKPCHAVSSSLATSIVVRSAYCAPTICTPIGSPSGEKPSGAAVAGNR